MSPDPYRLAGDEIDFRPRFFRSTTVAASPAAAVETIIATITVTSQARAEQEAWLDGWAAFTVGTSGTAVRLRIRRTDTSGATEADTGALTGGVAATNLLAQDVAGVDALGAVGSQVYVLTLTVTGGAAVSTVSAVRLTATVV